MKPIPTLAVLAACLASPANAASLQVAPVLLDLPAPATTATITLRNTDVEPIAAQIRVFRWTQVAGEERLEPTEDVVASPPVVNLRSRQDYTVRVIRVSGRPLGGEESYRLVVDELPKSQRVTGTIALVMRHVVPVFFTGKAASRAAVSWQVSTHGKSVKLTAVNDGDTRVRLAGVSLRDPSGTVLSAGKGLMGYSLGRSAMQWTLAAPARPMKAGTRVILSGLTETGPFDATIPVQAAR